VTSITTNNIHTLSQLDEPILNLPYSRFLLFWGLYGIIVAIWIASSQPKIKTVPQELGENEPPDLVDFAMEEESKTDGINETDAGSEKDMSTRDRFEKNDWLEVELSGEEQKDQFKG
jgi:hypothetical protein